MNVGDRVEIPVHYDLWMQGARFGVVKKIDEDFIRVRMNHPQVQRLVLVKVEDKKYLKKAT